MGKHALCSAALRVLCMHSLLRTWPRTCLLVCLTITRGKQFIAAACTRCHWGSKANGYLL